MIEANITLNFTDLRNLLKKRFLSLFFIVWSTHTFKSGERNEFKFFLSPSQKPFLQEVLNTDNHSVICVCPILILWIVKSMFKCIDFDQRK